MHGVPGGEPHFQQAHAVGRPAGPGHRENQVGSFHVCSVADLGPRNGVGYPDSNSGPVAQRSEQGTHNPLVLGSNPIRPISIHRPTFSTSRSPVRPVDPIAPTLMNPSPVGAFTAMMAMLT